MTGRPLTISQAICVVLLLTLGMAPLALGRDVRTLIIEHNCTSIDPLYLLFGGCYGFHYATGITLSWVPMPEQRQARPYGAVSWSWSEDRKTITFELDDTLKWSDGQPVIAEDFALAWRRILRNTEVLNSSASSLGLIEGADDCADGKEPKVDLCAQGIKPLGQHRLAVSLTQFAPSFVHALSTPSAAAVPSHYIAEHGERWASRIDVPFAGPYQVSNLEQLNKADLSTQTIEMVRNPHSPVHDDLAFDSIRALPERKWTGDSYREAIQTGEMPDLILNFTPASDELVHFLLTSGWAEYELSSETIELIIIDGQSMPAQMLEAIQLILDSNDFVQRGLDNRFEATNRLIRIREKSDIFENPFRVLDRSAQIERAKALLTSIGITPEQPETLILLYDLPLYERDIEIVKGMLGNFGLTIEAQFFPYFGGEDYEQFRALNTANMEIMIWTSPFYDPAMIKDIVDVSVMNPIPADKRAWFKRKVSEYLEFPEGIGLASIESAEAFLVRDAGFVPLAFGRSTFLKRTDLCTKNRADPFEIWRPDRLERCEGP